MCKHNDSPISRKVLGGVLLSAVYILQPFSSRAQTMYDAVAIGTYTYGTALNGAGQVAGTLSLPNNSGQGFVTDPVTQALTALVPSGSGGSNALAINAAGDVALIAIPPGGSAPRLYVADGTTHAVTAVTMPNVLLQGVVGINASGQVAGSFSLPDGSTHAYVTGSGLGAMIDLGALGGTFSFSNAINASGQVVGRVQVPGGNRGFVTDSVTHAMTALGTFGGSFSVAQDINDAGQAAGYAALTGDGAYHAFITNPVTGALVDLGTLGGSSSFGMLINASGQVAGISGTTGSSDDHAFVTDGVTGTMIDIGAPVASSSYPTAMNAYGMVVGYFHTPGQADQPFLFDGTATRLLNALLSLSDPLYGEVEFDTAVDINGNGQILANGHYIAGDLLGQRRAFLLTPKADEPGHDMPEPASFTFVTTALAGLLLARRKKVGDPVLCA